MSIFFRAYGSTADTSVTGTSSTTYSTARAATNATTGAATTVYVGQRLITTNYTNYQVFFVFDTSTITAGSPGTLSLNCATGPATGGDTLEVAEAASTSAKLSGTALTSLTPLGTKLMSSITSGRNTISLSSVPATATFRLAAYSQKERLNTAPTGDDAAFTYLADNSGTTSDPWIDILTGTAWDFVAAGTSVEATATSHILTEPAGAASGDLLVACISSRIASTTSITLPSGWALVAEAKNNNTLSTSSALPSGMMAYILRGGSAPSYTFTHPVAPNVALGRVVAYRNVDQTTPKDTGTTAVTTGTAITAVSVTGLTTTVDDDLIVALTAGGQESTWSTFNATDPATSSGTTSASVLDPIWGQWLERAEQVTTTGNDTSLAIYDAVKQTAGATGNLTATASVSSGHVVVAGSFKLAVVTGDTYDEDQDETLSAAEEVAISQFVRSGPIAETAASADTVAGLLDATRVVAETAAAADTQAGTLVTDKAIAETLAAVDILTGGLAFDVTVAETASAAETILTALTYTHVVAETVSAADTVGGLLVAIGALAESAGAAETTDAEVVPAAGVFDEIVAETAGAADTLGGLLVTEKAIAESASAAETLAGQITFTGAIAETAAAAETITKTLTFTGAIAETAAAADTVGGLLVRIGAVVETASAAETTAGLLTFTAAVAEVAAADETIVPIVVPAGGTLYEEEVLETLAATDTFTAAGMTAAGVILETLAANDTVVADLISGEVTPEVPVIGGPGPAGEGVRRRFELYLLPEEDEDEEKPRRKRRLRLKKAELEDKIEATIEYIEAGSPRPMSQQAMVAEVSTLMGLDALLEIDRRRVERTIYRYLQTLMEDEEEEGLAMVLLAA